MKQITIEVSPDGAVTIDAAGFSGADCEEATRFLEDALGTVTHRKHKPEYRQTAIRPRQRLRNRK